MRDPAHCCTQVRGTGASGGQWRMPWGFDERKDTAQVLDWLVGQRWSNGQVIALPQSSASAVTATYVDLAHSRSRAAFSSTGLNNAVSPCYQRLLLLVHSLRPVWLQIVPSAAVSLPGPRD